MADIYRSAKRVLYRILMDPSPGNVAARVVNGSIFALIILNILALVIETVEPIRLAAPKAFLTFEYVSVTIFVAEYTARLWCAPISPRFQGGLVGRMRWARSPMAIIDLLAILPALLPFVSIDLRVLRIARALRIIRLAKLGRYSRAMRLIGDVVKGQKEELITTVTVVCGLILVSSSLMYYAEHDAQPETFGSIPDAMWWSVVTLTTVGYGDTYPITDVGRLLGGAIALLGIGMVALPTGILGAGFVDAMQRAKRTPTCPHCGKPVR